MKKEGLLTAVIIFCLFLMTVTTLTTSDAQASTKAIKWRVQNNYGMTAGKPLLPELYLLAGWTKWVEDVSNGLIKVDIVPAGTVCSPFDTFHAISKGVLDGALTHAGFDKGIMGPIVDVAFGLPMAWQEPSAVRDAMEYYGLAKVIKEAYAKHNVLYFYAPPGMTYHIGTTFPLQSLSDITGKKIRAVGIYSEYVRKLGASPTVVPGPEMYMALKMGTLDGMVYALDSVPELKLHEVLKCYIVEPNLCTGNMAIYVSKKSVDALPTEIKNQIIKYSDYIITATSLDRAASAAKAVSISEKLGVKLVHLSQPDKEKVGKICMEIWRDFRKAAEEKNDAYVIKAMDILEQQQKDWGMAK